MTETAEELARHQDVREALDQATGRNAAAPEKSDKFWFATHLLLLVGCAVLYSLVGSKFIPLSQDQVELARRILRGAGMIIVLLAVSGAVSLYSISRVADHPSRFTLKRIKRLIVFILVLLVGMSVTFVNW